MPLLTKDSTEAQKVLSKIVAKSWLDEDFNSQFRLNPNAVLEENGLTLPSGVEFSVNDHTLVGIVTDKVPGQEGNVVYEMSLPDKPEGLAEKPIQSWTSGDNSDYPVSDCEEGSCRYTL
ncbi:MULTISPECIES: hypothetical protein [unclassified Coleofasciculus]|uniref:hypothetical protein n=1 Tax=unclassified Coleofasciculus TaxID=2692782 RepID=UPI0018810094|nr:MULTISPECIES: hypothetical protein [unclassified Coleofasciculus]MBE9128874.1 hypothetical protein [Coleofasciculus sp. LEGE 07081]MBE9151595.1 hypothetical protein [Coleofasciculus sp. LEGE 07092]